MARLSTATRHNVVILHQQGLSQTKISKQTGVSRCAVQALLKKHKETGNVEDRRRSGRPRKLNAADEKHIKLISLRNRKMSSSAISSELARNLHHASLLPADTHYCTALQPFGEQTAFFYSQIFLILTHQSRAPAAMLLYPSFYVFVLS